MARGSAGIINTISGRQRIVGASGWFIWQGYHVRHEAIVTEVCQKSALVNAELEKFVNTVKGIADTNSI
jgi:hypothetical protein